MLDAAEVQELAAKCFRSPAEFGRVLLPHWFPLKMPWFHRGILALMTGQTDFLLDFGKERWRDEDAEWTPKDLEKILTNFLVSSEPDKKGAPLVPVFGFDGEKVTVLVSDRTALMVPRGYSKTTLMNMVNLRDILYQVRKFIVYVSEAAPHAEKQLGTIRAELDTNELLKTLFGELLPDRNDSLKLTEKFIELRNGAMLGAAGRGGQVRGFGKHAMRPDRIVADDLEDEESVRTDEQIKKTKNWFKGTLEPSLMEMEGAGLRGDLFIIGTMLHRDALLPALGKDPDWMWIKFGSIDRQGEPLWEAKLSLAGLEKKRRSFAALGQLPSFYLEYMSEEKQDEIKAFSLSKMIYVQKGLGVFAGLALACDPAISEDRKADFCSYAVAGIENGGHVHCLDIYARVGMRPDEQVDKFFELHRTYMVHRPHIGRWGIEAVAYQRALISMVQAKMHEHSKTLGHNAYFEITPILHGRQGKIERVQGILQPRFRAGLISFQDRFVDLETQLDDWPQGKKDIPDSLSMAIKLLDPYAQLNAEEPGSPEDWTKDKAEPLEKILGSNYYGGCP